MKNILRNIGAFLMSLLVLFSTLSFSLEMHYCGDNLVDFSLIEKVDSCMMDGSKSKVSSKCSVMEMRMDCCTNVEFAVEGQEDLKLSFDKLSFSQQTFVASLVYSYIDLFEEQNEKGNAFSDYSPPPLIRDVQILDQTFLI